MAERKIGLSTQEYERMAGTLQETLDRGTILVGSTFHRLLDTQKALLSVEAAMLHIKAAPPDYELYFTDQFKKLLSEFRDKKDIDSYLQQSLNAGHETRLSRLIEKYFDRPGYDSLMERHRQTAALGLIKTPQLPSSDLEAAS